jgi:hypothetical protein
MRRNAALFTRKPKLPVLILPEPPVCAWQTAELYMLEQFVDIEVDAAHI